MYYYLARSKMYFRSRSLINCFRYALPASELKTNLRRRCLSTSKSSSPTEWPRVIFSGIQPTGAIHIGNYFGAIKNWVDMQNRGEDVIISIVDLHSITLPQEPAYLQKNILEMAAYLLGSGLDPERCTLFLQSTVPRHAELCWILTCLATLARLSHLPQYKEKSLNMKEVPLGLMVYPVLQAADILLYRATHVPVGEDQLQHLQMAAQLVKTFNHRFGKTFPTPQPVLSGEESTRLRSLRDPLKKMSKSDTDPKSRILLSDTPDDITKKIRKAVSDFTPQITYDMESRPGVSNLINIHCLATGKIPEEAVEEAEFSDTLKYKGVVAKALVEHIGPIRERAEALLSRPEHLRDLLQFGAVKARRRADRTMAEVNRRVGVGLPAKEVMEKVHVFAL